MKPAASFLFRGLVPTLILAGSCELSAQSFPNGDFESGSTGWTTWPAGASLVSGTLALSGTAAQLAASGSTMVIERDLNLLPGLNVTVSGYVRAVSPTFATGSDFRQF